MRVKQCLHSRWSRSCRHAAMQNTCWWSRNSETLWKNLVLLKSIRCLISSRPH